MVLVFGAGDASTQQVPAAGQRVRITSAHFHMNRKVATLIGVDDSTIRVALTNRPVDPRDPAFTDTVALSRAHIDRLDVSRSQKRGTGKGALIGLVSGGVVGAIAGAATYKEKECGPPNPGIGVICIWSSSSRGEDAMAGGLFFGLIGAGLGALIGSASHRDHWEGVAVKPLQYGGVGLGLGIRF
jgi:hypothetical protein